MNDSNHVVDLNAVFELCKIQFDKLQSSLKKIDSRLNSVEKQMKQIKKNNTKQCQDLSVTKIEDKIAFLNQNCQPTFSCDFLTGVHNELSKDKYQTMIHNDIISILNGHQTIYEISCRYICMISKETTNETDENIYSLYVFSYQKYILYYWNQDKLSWDKMSQELLNKLFNLIQQHILNIYSNIISIDDIRFKKIDLVECGSNLYVDNFDKKYSDFKKMIFQQLISL